MVRRKYFWTPELHEKLRSAYQAPSPKDKIARIAELSRITGFPRTGVRKEARRLGLNAQSKAWTAIEKQYLRDHVGETSISEIAHLLHRGIDATRAMALKLGFKCRIREGYSRQDIRQALGVADPKINRWLENGWLRLDHNDRVPERSLRAFLQQHSEEYSLHRVDEYWFKSMVFPSFGRDCRPQPRRADLPQQTEARA